MNRLLPWLNLFGVLALAVLCGFQWSANRKLHLQLQTEQQEKSDLKLKVDAQLAQMKTQAADLDQFRAQLEAATQSSRELENARRQMDRKVAQLETERDQLKASVESWSGAVRVRDERIKTDQEQLKKLSGELNASILKFNELAATHAELVKRWNEQQAKLAAMQTNTGEKNGAGAK